MKLTARIITRSSQRRIVFRNSGCVIYVHSAPERGKANREAIALLSEKFRVPISRITLCKGHTCRYKIFHILPAEDMAQDTKNDNAVTMEK